MPTLSYRSRKKLTSKDVYRYTLKRDLLIGQGSVCWVMLNPSTADDKKDDPTIRKVKGFTAAAGYRFIEVVNLFPHRATQPSALFTNPYMDNPAELWRTPNEHAVVTAINRCDVVMAAWGAWYGKNMHRLPKPTAAWTIAHKMGKHMHCLGENKDGSPKHPLYVPYGTELEMFT